MSVANCPSCGAPVEFAIGSSVVVICGYCRSVVARTDRGVESHGKVAALIDTGDQIISSLRDAAKSLSEEFGFAGTSLDDLATMKRAAGRPIDLIDLEETGHAADTDTLVGPIARRRVPEGARVR